MIVCSFPLMTGWLRARSGGWANRLWVAPGSPSRGLRQFDRSSGIEKIWRSRRRRRHAKGNEARERGAWGGNKHEVSSYSANQCTVKPRYYGFDEIKFSCFLLQKSVIANIESKRKKYQRTEAKFAIVRFFTTLGCVIARFYCKMEYPFKVMKGDLVFRYSYNF